MTQSDHFAPKQFQGVTVSSTFADLKEHRAALMKIIDGLRLKSIGMEQDSAKLVDVIESSFQMVRDGTAYIGVVSLRYGQTPSCPTRNPDKLSITELEFNEAVRLNRPILLFVMGEDHPVRKSEIESSTQNQKKLKTFRQRAKEMGPDSRVERVYSVFDSLEEFKEKAAHALAGLSRYLSEQEKAPSASTALPLAAPNAASARDDSIPKPPAFYAEPPYIGSHRFIGRRAQLETLNDWAAPADPHPILLFEAIGGTGKSMLTWEWINHHAANVRDDWAGRMWYSYYEKGAVMADFCQSALAYITGKPVEEFRTKKTTELADQLLRRLKDRPWLLVLDGLERVLVAYHRFDAAQLTDEEATEANDQIADRNPCASIRPEDDDLLRALAGAGPSKLLLTSRLIPRVLLNSANQPIPGVLRDRLPGLRPIDAEALFKSCGIRGDSAVIQGYLKAHCDCHPLVIGVLAGLVNDFLPDRGNFDAWAVDPTGGGRLNLAALNLVQKRNHILHAAFGALSEKSRQLLSILAILSESVDYATLSALNPHLPVEPVQPDPPLAPEKDILWKSMSPEERNQARKRFKAAQHNYRQYELARDTRLQSAEYAAAGSALVETVCDLERRGLLQYDPQLRRHDLHPVVRGVAAGGLKAEERETYGRRVVDHFSSRSPSPYRDAESLDDVQNGMRVVRTLLQMNKRQEACKYFGGELRDALMYNLEARFEVLTLIRPFFTRGWHQLPSELDPRSATSLAITAGNALAWADQHHEALSCYGATLRQALMQIEDDIQSSYVGRLMASISNIANTVGNLNRLAKEEQLNLQALAFAEQLPSGEEVFICSINRINCLVGTGRYDEAEAVWQRIDPMGRDWSNYGYRPGTAERAYAYLKLNSGTLKESHLAAAEELSRKGKNRRSIRALHSLRAEWLIELGDWASAVSCLQEAVRMAREVGRHDYDAETRLAYAMFELGRLENPRAEAERLSQIRDPAHLTLASFWKTLDDRDRAKEHALAAYRWSWADGEPYVHRRMLTESRKVLEELQVEVPQLPPYNRDQEQDFAWEGELANLFTKVKSSKLRLSQLDEQEFFHRYKFGK